MSQDTQNYGCACASPSAENTVAERATQRPAYTVTETAEAFDLVVFVPGANKDGVEIALEDNALAVTARRAQTAPEGWQPLRREIPEADYRLTLRINVPVDAASIAATVADGVLRVRLP